MRWPNLRLIGVLVTFLSISLFAGSRYWLATWEPVLLNAPISLAAGESTYSLHVRNTANYNLYIQVRPEKETRIRTAWSITGGGAVLESGAKEVRLSYEVFVGNVRLKPGDYSLRFNVLTDAHQLDQLHPLLWINADNHTLYAVSDRYDTLVKVSGCICVVGVFLILFSFRRSAPETEAPKGVAIAAPDRVRRFPGYGRRLRVPNFGYTATVFFGLMMFFMMVLTGWKRTSTGLWVQLLKPGAVAEMSDKWSQPIIVRVETTRKATGERYRGFDGKYYPTYDYQDHFFVNEEEVQEKELKEHLRALLVTRKDRTVFIKGSNDSLFQQVAMVVDTAKGAYASRVVLVTEAKPGRFQTGETNVVTKPAQNVTLPIQGDFVGIQRDESLSPDEPGVKWFHENTLVVRNNEAVLDKNPFTVSKGRKEYSASDGGFVTYRGKFIEKDGGIFISLRLFQSDYVVFPVPVNGTRTDHFSEIRTYPVETVSGDLVIDGVRYNRKVLKKEVRQQMLTYLREQSLEKTANKKR